jgi:hypothetical protein
MMRHLSPVRYVVLLSFFLVSVLACTIEPTTDRNAVRDEDLFHLAQSGGPGWVWYKFTDSIFHSSDETGHNEDMLRTRYNRVAATQLDASGKVKADPQFPDSSLIVKELYGDDGQVSTYAVMMKLRSATNAGPNGWVWGYYRPTGKVRNSVDRKGGGCAGCHEEGLDYTRMNDAIP